VFYDLYRAILKEIRPNWFMTKSPLDERWEAKMHDAKAMAKNIVTDILKDLRDRKGVGDELYNIDADIYEEMEGELQQIVLEHLVEIRCPGT